MPPEAWVEASRRESEAWNGRAERERKRARMEEGRIAKAAAAAAARGRDGGRARERVKGGAEAKREQTPEVEAEETCAMRAARKVYDERMERVRRVTRRRATTLARAATVVVDPETCKVMGRLNAEELRETTLDPANRTLIQVSMADVAAADEMFRVLMGDKVEPRREFIEKHALEVRNLDV